MIQPNSGIAKFQAILAKSQPADPTAVQTTGQKNSSAPNYGTGVLRLQALLANRHYTQSGNNPPQIQSGTTVVNQDSEKPENSGVYGAKVDNQGNLYISRDLLGYSTPMSAEQQLELVQKYENKKFNRDAAYNGISALGNAFNKTGGFSTVFGSYDPR